MVRRLYELGYDADELRLVFRWIDRMMQLRSDLDALLTVKLTEFEEEKTMPYVTSVERFYMARAEAQGEERGKTQGLFAGVTKFLSRLCGPLPEEIQTRISELPRANLELLAEDAADMHSIENIEAWLQQHSSNAQ